jgi:hypothetical protein
MMTRMQNTHLRTLTIALFVAIFLALTTTTHADAPLPDSVTVDIAPIEASFAWRDAFLPPGVPTVAIRSDETAMLWNPAGMAYSGTYYLGYAWKGTYRKDVTREYDKEISTHFFLTKARGFAFGYVRDSYSEGEQNMFLFSLAPRISEFFSLGWTGKWKAGFNFDVGTMVRLGPKITLGFVGRDLRERSNTRRYWETGLAVTATRRLLLHYDVIVEDSSWRIATAHGGGFYANLKSGISFGASYFTDGEGNGIIRGSLKLMMPGNVIDSEYSNSTDDYQTLGVRISSHNP